MITFDTETIGFHGPIVTIQHDADGEIKTHHVWYEPAANTIELIARLVDEGIIGFNLTFDWFHICQLWDMLTLLGPYDIPIEHIEKCAQLKPGRTCLKPKHCLDLFGCMCSGKYQSLMNRDPIKISRVPIQVAELLAQELYNRVDIPDIYFARKSDGKAWDLKRTGDDDFVDVVLRFAPSRRLKDIATNLLGFPAEDVLKLDSFTEGLPKVDEIGYAPGQGNWPRYIRIYANFWYSNPYAIKYAKDDVIYTKALYEHLGKPEADDATSRLACMVGATRWKGFKIDIDALKKLRSDAYLKLAGMDKFSSFLGVRRYFAEVLTPDEIDMIKDEKGDIKTDKITLAELSTWCEMAECECGMDEKCPHCSGMGWKRTANMLPIAKRASDVMVYRQTAYAIGIYNKLISAGRFHPSFKVVGTRSNRMAGADDLNSQGIPHDPMLRKCFTLADEGEQLIGGDFSSFEMTIQDAIYYDSRMHEEIVKSMNSGYKLHADWGHRYFFPHMTYDQIKASGDTARTPMENYYLRSKQGVFSQQYFGEAHTLHTRVGIPIEQAEWAYKQIQSDYSELARARMERAAKLIALSQPDGIGHAVKLIKCQEYAESAFGFRRSFELEYSILRALYSLAQDMPASIKRVAGTTVRREREQSMTGATQSALYGAAFNIQSSIIRAAGNHIIQSSGAEMTKTLQLRIDDLQPAGIRPWRVRSFNVHDELMVVTDGQATSDAIGNIVTSFVEEYKSTVPLLRIDWSPKLDSWADK